MDKHEQNKKVGLICATSTYLIWGILPIYWAFLSQVDAYSILAQRIIWTLVIMLIISLGFRFTEFKQDCLNLWTDKKKLLLLLLASMLISINWFIYIWAVNHNHVIDTSIGYYLNPLFSVLLGVLLFKEYLILPKRISIFIATLGIIILTINLGKLPWISLGLTFSFGLYGAVKKFIKVNPFTSITLETIAILPASIIYFYMVDFSSWHYFNLEEPSTMLFLIGTGIATAVPMVLFSYGANNLPLNLLGFLQYISPTMTLILAIFYFHETFTFVEFSAFFCIWIALFIFTISEKINKKIRIKTK